MGSEHCARGCRALMVRGEVEGRTMLGRGILAFALAWVLPAAASAQRAASANAQQPAAAAPLVFDGVTVVDVEQGKLVPSQRVVIAGHRIEAVGGAAAVTVPPGAQVVDARGKYLIPGLWDMHVHTASGAATTYPLFVVHGVTGFRDAGESDLSVPFDSLFALWQAVRAGALVGPPRQLIGVYDQEQSAEELMAVKAQGANFLKVYPFSYARAAAARKAGLQFGGHVAGPTMAILRARNLKEIQKAGLSPETLAGYGDGSTVSAIEASDSGISILDHTNSAGDLDLRCLPMDMFGTPTPFSVEQCRQVADVFRRNGTWWCPTLVHRYLRNGPIKALHEAFFAADSTLRSTWSRDALHTLLQDFDPSDMRQQFHLAFADVGIPTLTGTDTDAGSVLLAGLSTHVELALFVLGGMSPAEALRAATLNPAKLIHGTDSLGTVAPGKLADLVLLDADPLADITNTAAIRAVVANGRYFDRAALDQLLTDIRTAKANPEP